MNTTESIIFITGIVGIALVLIGLLVVIQAIACDNCPYKDDCKTILQTTISHLRASRTQTSITIILMRYDFRRNYSLLLPRSNGSWF